MKETKPNLHLQIAENGKVLALKDGELLTYKKLEKIGIGAIRIDKISSTTYEINFSGIDSYEEWLVSFQTK